MNRCKPVGSPLHEHRFANNCESKPFGEDQHAMYRSIMGSLMYIATRTRSDLAVVTSMLPSYLYDLRECHITAAKRVLRPFKGTRNKKMKLKPKDKDQPTVFVGASLGKFVRKGRRSCSGMIINSVDAVIAVTTTTQKCVRLSPTDLEYVALSEAVQMTL